MNIKKSKKVLAQENMPTSSRLIGYRRCEAIPIATIAKKHEVTTQRVVSLVGALIMSEATYDRLAEF